MIIINNAKELKDSLMKNKGLELDLKICEHYFIYKHHMFNLVFKDDKYYYMMIENNNYNIELFNTSVFASHELSTKMSEMVYCYMSSIPNEDKVYLVVKREHEDDITRYMHGNSMPYSIETSAGVILAQEKLNNYYYQNQNEVSDYIKNNVYTDMNINNELCVNLSDVAYLSLTNDIVDQEVEKVKNIFKKL